MAIRDDTTLNVVMIDPLNYTPYYDLNLCAALVAKGWNVELLTSPYMFETIDTPPGVVVKNVCLRYAGALMERLKFIRSTASLRGGIKAISYPFDLMQLDRELAVRPVGILHVQWALLPLIDELFWKRWKKKGWKIVYTAHDVDGLDGTTPKLLARTNQRLFEIADAVLAHSKRDCEQMIRDGANPLRINCIPQGTPGLFYSQSGSREDAKKELGIGVDAPTILFFGLLKAYKSLETLLTAMVSIREQIPGVMLLIVGKPLANHEHYARLLHNLGLADSVRWERAYVPSARVGTYFAASDVVALPYRAASSSAVLFNAYAHSVPVVATTVGAFPETVQHGETGFLVPPESPRELAQALVTLLCDPELARNMGERGRQYATAHHEWDSIGQLTADIYESIIDRDLSDFSSDARTNEPAAGML